jgi:hypothetical protein
MSRAAATLRWGKGPVAPSPPDVPDPSPPGITQFLIKCLGPTLVAALSGARDVELPEAWARGDAPQPSIDSLRRMEAALQAWKLIARRPEDQHIARAWFIGANPVLGDRMPVVMLRAGECDWVLAAARNFVND